MTMRQDLRDAIRTMRRSPGFTLLAVGMLGLAIGVNATAFGLINALVFRPLPGVEARDRLVTIYPGRTTPDGVALAGNADYVDFAAYAAAPAGLDGLAAAGRTPLSVAAASTTAPIVGELVSDNYFDVLGAHPARGRFFTRGEARPGQPLVAVIAHALAERWAAGGRDVVGTTISVNGLPVTIVGIAPPEFAGTHAADLLDPREGPPQVWLPLGAAAGLRAADALRTVGDGWLGLVGRLAPRSSAARVEASLAVAARSLAERYPRERGGAFLRVRPLGYGPQETPATRFAMVALFMSVPLTVLLVACANLANLLLARGHRRRREVAVRLSLGATPGRIRRLLLVESGVLALLAAGLGTLIALWAGDIARWFGLAMPGPVPLDARVLAFALGVTAVTTAAFGLAPAVRASRGDVSAVLKDGDSGGTARSRLRSVLVVAQVAASLVLLILCGLAVRAVQAVRGTDFGIRRPGLVVAEIGVALPADSGRMVLFERTLLEHVAARPEVRAAALASFAPFRGGGELRVSRSGDDASHALWATSGTVTAGFFAVAGMPLAGGREFTAADAGGARVAIVNRLLARRLWPEGAAVGQLVRVQADSSSFAAEVVGVVGDAPAHIDQPAAPAVYLPLRSDDSTAHVLWVRGAASDAEGISAVVRTAARQLDPAVSVDVGSADRLLGEQLRPLRLLTSALAAAGALALILAVTGLYAVVAYLVELRTREIGVRVALGATERRIVRLVVGQGMWLVGGGVVAGAGAALGLSVLLRGLFLGVPAGDPATFAAVAVLTAGVALVAAYLPARRAAEVDPMVALRTE